MKTIENEQKIAQKIFTAATESGLVDNDDFVSSSNLPIEIEKLNLLANALISCKMFDEETPYLQGILDDYTTFVKFKIRLNGLLTND